ncbi:MAG: nucleotidyltransferase family protein [Lachnospiraceae bacterium]|nr:nucleotidyltransferase family protein [Lachnospiraceae bacterium]
MKITAVIAEYNPFHKGHLYQIQKAREVTGADHIICIMSGDFVQRGTPAITDKYTRAEMALRGGADLVIELPVCYCLSSIENYAYGAVSLADKLGAVDCLCFGAENADTKKLEKLAQYTLKEDNEALNRRIKEHLKQGKSYPLAMSDALIETGLDVEDADILKAPNNALGIYYIRALLKLHSDIKPLSVKRIISDHHDTEPGALSGSAIRKEIMSHKEALFDLCSLIPDSSLQILSSALNKSFPVHENDLSSILFYKLHSLYTLSLKQNTDRDRAKRKALSGYLDVSEDLSSRILNTYRKASSFTDLCEKVKSRDMTYTRLCRCLMHILLDIDSRSMESRLSQGHYYARILGLNRNAEDLMHTLKEHSLIPFISKLADHKSIVTDETGTAMLYEDIQAADLYESVAAWKFNRPFSYEYTKKIVLIN